jgi:signal-transduction protein with cAMP-binding, CBS, and nucleotidyltransferase domain
MSEWLERLTDTVRSLVDRRIVIGSRDEPLLSLVGRMRAANDAAAVITDATGRVFGVLTAEDLLERALFVLEADQPVSAALSRRAPVLREHDRVYSALAAMERERLVIVDENGRPIGLIRREQLLAYPLATFLARLAPATIGEGGRSTTDVKAAQTPLAASLLADGQPVMEVVALINALNDDLMRAILHQTLRSMTADGWGEPPVRFALLVMGSAGRGEGLLNPDQDNGFILSDYPDQEHNRIDPYFIELAERLTLGLDAAGLPFCKGYVMATNPLWRKTLSQWQAQVTGWARSRSNEALMFTDIFFDFRTIFGPPELATALRHHVTEMARGNLPFLAQMCWQQKERMSNVDLFGRLIAEDGPEADAIELKFRAIMPLVQIVRLLALKSGVEATGTAARLAGLTEAGVLQAEDSRRLCEDLAFLIRLLLCHHLERVAAGYAADNLLQPATLGPIEREKLIRALRRLDRLRFHLFGEYLNSIA